MSIDNPYQSPETTSTPEPDVDSSDRVHTKFPTWRFWVLFSVCIPGFLVALLPVLYVLGAVNRTEEHLFASVPYGIALFAFLGSSILIFFRWRTAAYQEGNGSPIRRAKLFVAAVGTLAAFAVPSAMLSLCTPPMFLVMEAYDPSNPPIGLMVVPWLCGLIGVGVVIFLAHGLWLDARGRKPASHADRVINRPIPRLRARSDHTNTPP